MAGVGRQILRRTTLHWGRQHEIKTDGTAQLIWVVIGQNAVLQARRKQHEQTRAWGQIPVGLIERVAVSNRAAITHRQTRHQLIGLMGRMQPQHAFFSRAVTREVQNSTEMGIGVMVAANRLIPITDHGPATLQMQGHLASLKPKRIEIAPGLIHHPLGQGLKGLLLMQLPHPMQVPRPGTALAGVALSFAAKPQQSLHAGGLLQGVERKLRGCHHSGKELMQLKHGDNLKPLRFTVNTAQKSRPRGTGIR